MSIHIRNKTFTKCVSLCLYNFYCLGHSIIEEVVTTSLTKNTRLSIERSVVDQLIPNCACLCTKQHPLFLLDAKPTAGHSKPSHFVTLKEILHGMVIEKRENMGSTLSCRCQLHLGIALERSISLAKE